MFLTDPMTVSAAMLLIIYAVIFSEKIHRTNAAIIGAICMVGIGLWMDFYSQEQALMAIDANTILLLAAMMMLVGLFRQTGAFEYLAILIANISKAQPARLMIYLCIAVSVISMFLDNVTTIIIFAPLTLLITRILKLNPLPFLVAEAMLSNVGGIATLVGDPPNIMIGSAANIDFTRFLIHMAPPVFTVWVFSMSYLLWTFRDELKMPISASHKLHLDRRHAIKDPAKLIKTLIAIVFVVILFFIHHHLKLYPAYVAFAGLALALLLISPEPESLFKEINWSVLFFFAGLFVIVGGVESSGLLHLIGAELSHLAEDPQMLLLTCLLLMWVAALLSAFVDNIPFTVTMIPIIAGLESHGINIQPLWWALALGVGLGGNGTHIGATANIIVVSELEKSKIPNAEISPLQWMRKGFPVMFTGLTVSSVFYILMFDYFT